MAKRLCYPLGFLAVALFILPAGNVVKADVVDPKISLGPTGSCASTHNNPLQETSLTQSFMGLETGCINDFQNEIGRGVTLDRLVVNITSPFTGPISCEVLTGSPLNGVTPNGSSATSCTFFEITNNFSSFGHTSGFEENGDDSNCEDSGSENSDSGSESCGGIGHGAIFGLTFDRNFGNFINITLAQSVITPEPATLLLFGSGFTAFLANKKRLKSPKHSL
jgi:hypothetical protein